MTNRDTGYDREHRDLIRRIRVSLGIIILAIAVFSLFLGFALIRDDGMRPTVKSGSLIAYLRLAGFQARGRGMPPAPGRGHRRAARGGCRR